MKQTGDNKKQGAVYTKEKYCSRDYLENWGIPVNVLVMALNEKFWKFQKKLTSQLTLAWLTTVTIQPGKNDKTKLSKNQNCCNDIRNILQNKNKLENLTPKSVNLPGETCFH